MLTSKSYEKLSTQLKKFRSINNFIRNFKFDFSIKNYLSALQQIVNNNQQNQIFKLLCSFIDQDYLICQTIELNSHYLLIFSFKFIRIDQYNNKYFNLYVDIQQYMDPSYQCESIGNNYEQNSIIDHSRTTVLFQCQLQKRFGEFLNLNYKQILSDRMLFIQQRSMFR
ncbi:unnamed protein product [Paramecium pentaurelia]|uniref:Uncharacterized protein n=1 Tax=Paramecium pentaurelia TaxID=43138 RepID=A0A8S1YQN0_9CILI|nr:unnamed protein product [Paramecium pentaurelia]